MELAQAPSLAMRRRRLSSRSSALAPPPGPCASATHRASARLQRARSARAHSSTPHALTPRAATSRIQVRAAHRMRRWRRRVASARAAVGVTR